MKKAFELNSKIITKFFYLSIIIFLLSIQGCSDGDGPTETDNSLLLIADFNNGSDPINNNDNGGKLQQWDYGDLLVVETGYYDLGDADAQHGKYAAFVTLTQRSGTTEWGGGGLVVVFKNDESAMDISDYNFLEFDVKVEAGSALETTRVKLESSQGPIYIERLLSEYGITFSTEWQTARIPVVDFATLRDEDPDFWEVPDLTAITKFVTVSVRDNNAPNTQGTLLIDNIQLTK